MLMRVLHVDALKCPRCARPMEVLAFLSDPQVVRRILKHLRLPAEGPAVWPARSSEMERPELFGWEPWDPAESWAGVESVQEGERTRGKGGGMGRVRTDRDRFGCRLPGRAPPHGGRTSGYALLSEARWAGEW